jgi:hypothetical protein
LQPEIVLWILIMKSIIALCVVGSWWIDDYTARCSQPYSFKCK